MPRLTHFFILSFFALILGVLATGFSWVIYLITFDRLPREAEVFVSEVYRPANLVIDVKSDLGAVQPAWLAWSQGGEEARNMLAGTEQKMKGLSPRYIRLDHIFDDDYYGVVSGSSGNLQLNWSKLDETVDSMKAMGATPFFSLGYWPKAMASTKIEVPYNWSDWTWLIDQTIRHYSGEKGIANVYYEVWNEPDLESFGAWKYYGDKSYITLYDAAARGALAARNSGSVQPFKFGGPAITALYRNWVMAVVNHARANGLPLDFISWHRYNFFPARFEQDMYEITAWLGPNHPYELIISEWGPDPAKNSVYAGHYAAAHAVAVARTFLGAGGADQRSLHYGFAFEVKDGPGQGNQGWGVLTHDEADFRPKPRYYAFAYLKDMYQGHRIALTGEGSNVSGWASGTETDFRGILTNFHPSGTTREVVPTRFSNLNPGQYRLTWESTLSQRGEDLEAVTRTNQDLAHEFTIAPNEVLSFRFQLIEPFARDERLEHVGNSGFGKIILKQSP